jgi:rubrerythrin
MTHPYVSRLARLAKAYARAERDVIAVFFKNPPKRTRHLRWLKAQGYKEYSAIRPILDALNALYRDIDRGVSRRDYAELTEKLADETRHARMVMDLLEQVSGKKISPRDLTWLPQDRKLAKIRAQYSRSFAGLLHGSEKISAREIQRKDQALERAAITLTEGGGGALYQICSKLRRSGIEKKIARAFREILLDEMKHKDSGAQSLAALIHDQESFKRAAEIICRVSGQRLRMRNEQFGFPLTAKGLAALERRARRSAAL